MSDPLGQSGMLSLADFYDQNVFEAEQRAVGKHCWGLIGPADWVSQDGEWMTGTVAGRDVFVQRFGDRLVGFENVCSHRFAQLRAERRGRGPIQCPYHGWAFNADGIPLGIPHCRELFGVAPHQLRDRRLKRLAVQQKGSLVFAHLNADWTGNASDAFGRWASLFSAMDSRKLELFSDQEQIVKANWKLCFENTLDDYHIAAVHPTSFGSDGWLPPEQYRYEDSGSHFAMTSRRSGIDSMDADQVIDALGIGSELPVDYAIFHYFPNLLVGFFLKSTIIASSYEALSVGETRVRSYLFDIVPPQGRALSAPKRRYLASLFGKVLTEDRDIVERWNRGLRQSSNAQLYGMQECRLRRFEQSWSDLMARGQE
jgi:phenylpropionate dioxygenase-like ring-hydroxylating dioxygenase large terminal subunit